MSKFYDREGKEIKLLEWTRMIENPKYRVVKQTAVKKVRVSTIWLGLDHGFGKGPPLIFETIIFDKDSELDQREEKYSTLEEAIAGHLKAVALVKKSKKQKMTWRNYLFFWGRS